MPMLGSPLEAEAVWFLSLDALGLGSLWSEPVDVRRLIDRLAGVDAVQAGLRIVPVEGLATCLDRHTNEQGILNPPWPVPDGPGNGSVWGGFSAERTRQRAEQIYTAALDAYSYFSESLFLPLSPRLHTAAMLPAVARGHISFLPATELGGAPLITLCLEAKGSRPTEAAFDLVDVGDSASPFAGADERLKAARPQHSRGLHSTWSKGVLDIFGRLPAHQLLYKWLWDDLRGVNWFTGGPLSDWPSDRVPSLRASE